MSHPDNKLLDAEDTKINGSHHTIFKAYNPLDDNKMCLDEWIKLTMEEVFKKMVPGKDYLYE